MKNYRRIFCLFLTALMLFTSTFMVTATELVNNPSDVAIETEGESQKELMPRGSARCNNYDYLNAGLTMDVIAQQNGWQLVYYTGEYKHAHIYKDGVKIGRYDITSSLNQDPHFHLFSDVYNIHYWVAF